MSAGGRALTGGSNLLALLHRDHETVAHLFETYQTSGGDDKSGVADKIMRVLDLHARIEEELVYPAIEARADRQGRESVWEAQAQHLRVKDAIAELRDLDADEASFASRMESFMQDVQHHAEKEESDLFPLAEKLLGDNLVQLGRAVEARKKELQ